MHLRSSTALIAAALLVGSCLFLHGMRTLYMATHLSTPTSLSLQTESKIISLTDVPNGYRPLQRIQAGPHSSSLVLGDAANSRFIVITASSDVPANRRNTSTNAVAVGHGEGTDLCSQNTMGHFSNAYGRVSITHMDCTVNHRDIQQEVAILTSLSKRTTIAVHATSADPNDLAIDHGAAQRIIENLRIDDKVAFR